MTKVAKVEPKAVGIPQDIQDLARMTGFVDVRKELISIPRLQLGQFMSDPVKAGLGKAGDFMSKVKGKNYGKSVKIIPILISESAALIDDKTSELVCRSENLHTNTDGVSCVKCPNGQYWADWSEGKQPKCRTSIDVVCIVNDEFEMPQVLSFRKTSYKAGKALLNLVMHDKYKVPFGSCYTLNSAQATKDSYEYFVIKESIDKAELTEQELAKIIPIARQMIEMKKQGRLAHESEDVAVEAAPMVEEQEELPV